MAPAAAHHLISPVLTSSTALRDFRHPAAAPLAAATFAPHHQRLVALGGHLQVVQAQPPNEDHPTPSSASVDDAPVAAPSPSPPTQNFLEALDFAEVRSQEDARLLEDARDATRMGEKMTREQYAALRRKIGGTYKDFFKDSIEVEGDFVDEGWVDKSCRFCKKDTASEPRTVDKYGRYAHVACLENSNKSGNFFSRLFGM